MAFWGAVVKPGEKKSLDQEGTDILHLSQVCLNNPKPGKTYVRAQVKCSSFTLACLELDKVEHDSLDLFFQPQDTSFTVQGPNEVHFVGYMEPGDDSLGHDAGSKPSLAKTPASPFAAVAKSPFAQPATSPKAAKPGTSPKAVPPASPKRTPKMTPIQAAADVIAAAVQQSPKLKALAKAAATKAPDEESDEDEEEEEEMEDEEEEEEMPDQKAKMSPKLSPKMSPRLAPGKAPGSPKVEAAASVIAEAVAKSPKLQALAKAAAMTAKNTDDDSDEDEEEEEEGLDADPEEDAESEDEIVPDKTPKRAADPVKASPAKKARSDDSAAKGQNAEYVDYVSKLTKFLKQNGKTKIGLLGSKVPRPKGVYKMKAVLEENKDKFLVVGDVVTAK